MSSELCSALAHVSTHVLTVLHSLMLVALRCLCRIDERTHDSNGDELVECHGCLRSVIKSVKVLISMSVPSPANASDFVRIATPLLTSEIPDARQLRLRRKDRDRANAVPVLWETISTDWPECACALLPAIPALCGNADERPGCFPAGSRATAGTRASQTARQGVPASTTFPRTNSERSLFNLARLFDTRFSGVRFICHRILPCPASLERTTQDTDDR